MYGRSGTQVGVPWEGRCGVESKLAPSPAACLRRQARGGALKIKGVGSSGAEGSATRPESSDVADG
jgi:hypothetical protein